MIDVKKTLIIPVQWDKWSPSMRSVLVYVLISVIGWIDWIILLYCETLMAIYAIFLW